MLAKTTDARAGALAAFLAERHPYDTPAIVALPIDRDGSHGPYLDWIVAETLSESRTLTSRQRRAR